MSFLPCLIFDPGLFAADDSDQTDAKDEERRWLRAEAVTVITASFVEESISHAPATVIIITKRLFKERGYRNPLDLREISLALMSTDILRKPVTILYRIAV